MIFDRRSSGLTDEAGGSATKRLTYEEAVEEAGNLSCFKQTHINEMVVVCSNTDIPADCILFEPVKPFVASL